MLATGAISRVKLKRRFCPARSSRSLGSSLQRNDAGVWLCEYPGLSFQRSPVCACSLVSSLLLSGATMSQQSSLTKSAHSVRQVLTAYSEDSPLRRHQFNGRRQRGAAGDVLRRCFAIGANRPISRRDKDREQPSRKSALTRHRKIQLALALPFEERPGCVRAAAPVKTQQDVIVAVEDRYAPRRCHQRYSVAEILRL